MGDVKTVFDNAENVHTDEIEESVVIALKFLTTLSTLVINDNIIDFNYIQDQVNQMLKSEIIEHNVPCAHADILSKTKEFCSDACKDQAENHKTIQIALNRICMDRTLYSKFNISLRNILLKVWTYIIGHDSEDEMKTRLKQELFDMSGTCTSGFASRLVNIISGFGDFNIRISWGDQITGNVAGRLNAHARSITELNSVYYTTRSLDVVKLWLNDNIDVKETIINQLTHSDKLTDRPPMKKIIEEFLKEERKEKLEICVEDFAEKVLNEMMISSSKFAERQHFLLFFGINILGIREEMFEEFKNYISESDFDLFFRIAISTYEGCNIY
jgi:hypothetical protein